MLNVTLRQLRALQAIYSSGKISSAAKELGLTAPAVTLQLKQMEEEAGTVLFDRTADGMRPTDAGLAFIDAAQAISERLRLLQDEVDAIKGIRKGTLRLGVVSTAKYFAPQLMAGFMKEFPDIEMTLATGNRQETIANLKNHAVDIALMGRPPKDVPVRAMVFGDHPLVIVARPDHPLAGLRDISKKRIAQEHFLIRERGSGTRVSLEIFLGEIPGRLDNLGTEMGSNETIKQAVMAGLGIAFISAHTVASELETGRLVILDVVGMPIRRQWFSISRSDRVKSPAMSVFESFLLDKGAMYLPLLSTLYPDAAYEKDGTTR
ncbi:LysR family transcriptional regulator [Chelativorans salis]|uniref:HTH-type transcriptional regulator CbbR n=1 Tax=Chelativorans salis TaxID=2978478 RepID=A0ABT2LKH5_9HYPH|nr:LysR family transcriptional regulator [Chelativorans sp. EGI FJ00035]MCT7374307.1 LysR substrate-binding domain-containing protein [Chelativorans sp. EGI FJ00035]